MRAKRAGRVLTELADLTIRAAIKHLQVLAHVQATADEENAFWGTLCDERWVFPGDGPPDPDTDRQRTEMFVCDYTLVWYETDMGIVRTRIRRALLDLLD